MPRHGASKGAVDFRVIESNLEAPSEITYYGTRLTVLQKALLPQPLSPSSPLTFSLILHSFKGSSENSKQGEYLDSTLIRFYSLILRIGWHLVERHKSPHPV